MILPIASCLTIYERRLNIPILYHLMLLLLRCCCFFFYTAAAVSVLLQLYCCYSSCNFCYSCNYNYCCCYNLFMLVPIFGLRKKIQQKLSNLMELSPYHQQRIKISSVLMGKKKQVQMLNNNNIYLTLIYPFTEKIS